MVAKESKDRSNDMNVPEQTSEIISLYDVLNKKILYISPPLPGHRRIDMEEIIKNPSIIREKLYPEDADRLFQLFESPSSSPCEMDYQIKGEERWLRTTFIPITDPSGNVLKVLNFTREITYWRKRGQYAEKTNQMNLCSQIAAGFAHEIRNPLTTIKGFLQLMYQDKSDIYQQMIIQETERIESIINEFLMLAQPYPGQDFILINVKDIVGDIFLTINPQASESNIKVFMTGGKNLPSVNGSPEQIKQALLNLIKNAIQAMPLGGTLYISVAKVDEGVSIMIKDEGTGISPKKLSRLGIPFYSNKEEGAGLGIMISRQIIKNHQGTVTFESEIGKGTIVEVILPSADVSDLQEN
ncbi:PAS domain-containing sensor histidine kinase [Siminovitchia terrae]|uniref:histidine kinase n=2 Tax=Siminovitchia terrae TaxID=1914933 RepID=A0A429XAC0_SIMTE|nr:PAS domain-containing sensor histidine kinase [Siminovitchia terrae]